MIDSRPVNFVTIGAFLKVPAKTIYYWYREYLSGYKETIKKGLWRKHDIKDKDGKVKAVPILKPENIGQNMTLDEKMIDDEMYTVMSNMETGKIALLAETMQMDELNKLSKKFGESVQKIKHITCDLSPAYDSFCTQSFPNAMLIADKFHIIAHVVESVQDVRIRCKQEELSELPKDKKAKRKYEQETKLENGETRVEMLTRSRYLLFKLSKDWKPHQQKRAALLFKTYPIIEKAYHLSEQIRQWYDKKNIGRYEWLISKQLQEWYEKVEDENIPEINNLAKIFMHNEEKITNYFIAGKTNAMAEAINSKIQRFVAANYGVRDKDFFLFRLAKYFS